MRTVTAMDMRKRLGEILDAASAGERILIERDHRPLAYLVSVDDGERLSQVADDVRRRRLPPSIDSRRLARRCAPKYPPQPGDLDAVASVRLDRDRDEPGSSGMGDLPPIVVDSSVAIALVQDEPSASLIRPAVRDWAEFGRSLLVPSLFWLEVLNPLARHTAPRARVFFVRSTSSTNSRS